MAKTQEELTQLKVEFETLSTKLKELSEDELKIVTGGIDNNGLTSDMIGFLKPNGENRMMSGSMIHAPTFGEPSNKEVEPSSSKGWFGNNNQN